MVNFVYITIFREKLGNLDDKANLTPFCLNNPIEVIGKP